MFDDVFHVFSIDFEVVPYFLHIVEMHEDEFRAVSVIPFQTPRVAFVDDIFAVPFWVFPSKHYDIVCKVNVIILAVYGIEERQVEVETADEIVEHIPWALMKLLSADAFIFAIYSIAITQDMAWMEPVEHFFIALLPEENRLTISFNAHAIDSIDGIFRESSKTIVVIFRVGPNDVGDGCNIVQLKIPCDDFVKVSIVHLHSLGHVHFQ